MKAAWRSNFLLVIVSIGLALLLGEGILRVFKIGYGHAPLISHEVFHHWHEPSYDMLVWGANNQFGGFHTHFNREGFAMSNELPVHEPSILFLGDSFTEAIQVPEEQRFAWRVANQLGIPYINFGCSSFSPLLSFLQLQTFSKVIQPKIVILQIFTNDIEDDSTYRKMARKEQGKIVAVTGSGNSPLIRILRRSYLARLVKKSYLTWKFSAQRERNTKNTESFSLSTPFFTKPIAEWYSKSEIAGFTESLVDIDQFCKARDGCKFFVFAIPDRGALVTRKPDYFYDFVRSVSQEHNIHFIDVRDRFLKETPETLFFETDIHLKKRGHELVADEILSAITVHF